MKSRGNYKTSRRLSQYRLVYLFFLFEGSVYLLGRGIDKVGSPENHSQDCMRREGIKKKEGCTVCLVDRLTVKSNIMWILQN